MLVRRRCSGRLCGRRRNASTAPCAVRRRRMSVIAGAQAPKLTTLCDQAKIEPARDDLSKAEASKMIDALRAKLDL